MTVYTQECIVPRKGVGVGLNRLYPDVVVEESVPF